MFGIGFPELVVIFVVALIVLGPERLPDAARSVARVFFEFKRAAEELKKELGADEIVESKSEVEKVKRELLEKVYNPLEPIEISEPKTKKTSSQKSSPKETNQEKEKTPETEEKFIPSLEKDDSKA
ncbi:Sec-independent protein translocase protein TatB [Thermodesulfatator atlanticus]|uniref:Sec-independent protein translocase protein TatB n=1 Tax=Thermodesulfatator atlanticus TaxID=501497 RepID=UPI0004033349|nr:Sec-independent protein translocase protein TatB [Thermodesulfatator atlanticus]